MAPYQWQHYATMALQPTAITVIVTFLIATALPVFLHMYLYRRRTVTQLPEFLLIGPSGAGKTSLLTLFERGAAAQTHTSQVPLTVRCSLPLGTVAASNRFRSVNDPTNKVHKEFLLIDTPGHGKLRQYATDSMSKPHNLKGIVFVVDSAALSADVEDTEALTETAQYLHDILLTLQTRQTRSKSSRGVAQMPVMVAANKLDLFTALPAKLVKSTLESEITRLRSTKSKGLLDSGVGMDDNDQDDREVLGGAGEGKFEFKLMEEYDVPVEVLGGSVQGAEPDTAAWWTWIGQNL
ncbi:MAG: hypothetical protein Q9159_001402 [Coniocarpon cinnabarinum]